MRKPIMAGNWKMNKTSIEAVKFLQELPQQVIDNDDVEAVICAPFTALRSIATVIEIDRLTIKSGAQNMHWEASGAYTGEISSDMLKDLLVEYVIIGHSERRQYFGETDETVNKKVRSCLAAGLKPIMCVGESLAERESGRTESLIVNQVQNGLAGISAAEIAPLVIAYEPIWAIGTGMSATPNDANEVCRLIRRSVRELFSNEVADGMRILYGGSVSPNNVGELMEQADIDGGLVGGASLDPESFAQLITSTAHVYSRAV